MRDHCGDLPTDTDRRRDSGAAEATATRYRELARHAGHRIVCVTYAEGGTNVAIECEDCAEVICDADRPPRAAQAPPATAGKTAR